MEKSMKTEWPSTKVRKTFIDFMKSKHHTYQTSSSVIPHDDPSLLFTNAGMNQFKPIFLDDPSSPFGQLKRACNTQKCIRAGGKHNDLKDVGKDTFHHTFFEMLGNWSFGDYFKQEAISYAWELLTQVFKLPESRIYVTYFQGDDELKLDPDIETRDIWYKYLPKEKVLPFGCKENFWDMGETGPCGPCTEIHFDIEGNIDASRFVNSDNDHTCIEVWNLVFIQFNRDGGLKPLTANHVDTGMGFERLTSILQGKKSNYDTDLFHGILDAIHESAGSDVQKYNGSDSKLDIAYRVMADHVRSLCVAVADGCYPGNKGRNYVIRNILRRAMVFEIVILQSQVPRKGFFNKAVKVFVDLMKDTFPELKENENKIQDKIEDEEVKFLKTYQAGKKKFEKATKNAKRNSSNKLSGNDVFKLWDTYGFPLDITLLMAEEEGLSVDEEEFDMLMSQAREKSRKNQ